VEKKENMELKFEVRTKIQKSISEVFDAVYNPDKLSSYFTTGGASAPLEEGTTVRWAFADNPGDEAKSFPVEVETMVKNELIVLRCKLAHRNRRLLVSTKMRNRTEGGNRIG
jgi:uncharacterized protein YndB with AHSA1/START domain